MIHLNYEGSKNVNKWETAIGIQEIYSAIVSTKKRYFDVS